MLIELSPQRKNARVDLGKIIIKLLVATGNKRIERI